MAHGISLVIMALGATKMTHHVKLIVNAPAGTGVGNYTISLFNALVKSDDHKDLEIKYQMGGFQSIFSAVAAYKRIRKEDDLFHICNGQYSFLTGKFNPSVITVHDLLHFKKFSDSRDYANLYGSKYLLYNRLSRILNPFFAQRASYLVVPTKAIEREAIEYLRVKAERIVTIHHGVDHSVYKPRDKTHSRVRCGIPLTKFVVLHVGSEEPRKNLLVLFESVKLAMKRNPNIFLVRVGTPTSSSLDVIKTLGIEQSVMYITPSDEALPYVYNSSDVFLYPSYYEGFGLPLIEAMSSMVPVISTTEASISEVVGNLTPKFDPFDSQSIADFLVQLSQDRALTSELSRASFDRGRQFSWDRCASETLKVYRSILHLF